MPVPPGASARDLLLDFADQARAQRQEALAKGDTHLADQWDKHERTLLRYAYEDLPYPGAGSPAGDNELTTASILKLPVGPNGEYVSFPYPSNSEEEPGALKQFFIDLTGFLDRNFPKKEDEPDPYRMLRGVAPRH